MTEKPPRARLKALIEKEEKPWTNEEALEISLEELELNQSEVADRMGCSTPTISNWKNKLKIGEKERNGKTNEGVECVRCGENDTPDNPHNELCNECLDYVRDEDSGFESKKDYSKEVINV